MIQVVVVHKDGTKSTEDVDRVFITNSDTWGDPPWAVEGEVVLYIDPSAVAYFYTVGEYDG